MFGVNISIWGGGGDYSFLMGQSKPLIGKINKSEIKRHLQLISGLHTTYKKLVWTLL
jgi:hypothetical protein